MEDDKNNNSNNTYNSNRNQNDAMIKSHKKKT